MVDSRTKSKTARSIRKNPAAPDAAAGGYERGHDAPFSPTSEESSGRDSPAVREGNRRAEGSTSDAKLGGAGSTGTVEAPKAPELTRGKAAAQDQATSAVDSDRRAQLSRKPDSSR